jgi:VWFA-related protein
LGQQKEIPAPTIRVRAELVLVPAIVTQGGKPVRGLTVKDFVLLHNGQPEKVEVFEEIDAALAKVKPVALPPRTVQNFATANSRQDVVILFLDYLNSSWSTRARIHSFLGDMTRQFAEARTPVSVFLLAKDGLIQLHSFASDLGNLTKAIERWQFGKASAPDTVASWASPFAPTEAAQTSTALRQLDLYRDTLADMDLRKAEMTVDAIQQVAEAYRGVLGRKKLVWMSTGFPGGTWDAFEDVSSTRVGFEAKLEDKLARAWKSLSQANIAVYPIDSNGVVNPEWESKFAAEYSGSARLMRPAINELPTNTKSLLEVAEKTGGRTCTTFPTKCVAQALSDGNHYYVLGFYLYGDSKPGWHKLKVTVNQSQAGVRARAGFLVAAAPTKAPTIGKEEVDTALASPLDYTSLPLRLNWSTVSTQGNETQIVLELSSPPGVIAVNPDDSRINVDYLAFIRPVGKTEGRTFPATLTTWLSPEGRKIFEQGGFRFRKLVNLPPARYQVRVLLRDNLARKMGTVSTIIDLSPAPAATSPAPKR